MWPVIHNVMHIPIYLSDNIYLSIYLFIYLSIYLSVHCTSILENRSHSLITLAVVTELCIARL